MRYAKFLFFGFINSVCLFENLSYSAYRTFYAEFRTIGIFEISPTIQKLLMKAFNFFFTVCDHSARPFLDDFQLFYVQNVVE